MGKLPLFHGINVAGALRPDKLQLVADTLDNLRTRLGADTYPIDTRVHRYRTVTLNRNLKAGRVQRVDDSIIDLQHWFAAGNYDIAVGGAIAPQRCNLCRQCISIIAPTIFAISANKIGVAKLADGDGAVGLAPRPQIAAGKAQENRAAARMDTFALQRQENLFDGITHA